MCVSESWKKYKFLSLWQSSTHSRCAGKLTRQKEYILRLAVVTRFHRMDGLDVKIRSFQSTIISISVEGEGANFRNAFHEETDLNETVILSSLKSHLAKYLPSFVLSESLERKLPLCVSPKESLNLSWEGGTRLNLATSSFAHVAHKLLRVRRPFKCLH